MTNDNQVMEIGFDSDTITSGYDFEFYKGQKDRTDRIGILSDKARAAYVHYVEGGARPGYYLCLSERGEKGKISGAKALCCQKEKDAKRRFCVPIVRYGTDTKGLPKKPFTWEVMGWIFTDDKAGQLKTISVEWGPLTGYDLKVTCSEVKYQRLDIKNQKEALWKAKPELEKAVRESAEPVMEKLARFLGRRMSEPEWKAHYGLPMEDGDKVNPNQIGSDLDVESLLDDET